MRNIWQVTRIRAYNVSGTSCKLLTSRKVLQRIRNVCQVIWRRGYNIPGTSFNLLEQDVISVNRARTVLQGTCRRFLQRLRKVLQVTWRRCVNVSGISDKSLQEELTTYQERLASYLEVKKNKIYRCMWTWPQEACACACALSLNHRLSMHFLFAEHAFLVESDRMSQPRVPKCYSKGLIPGCCSPKPTPCPRSHSRMLLP